MTLRGLQTRQFPLFIHTVLKKKEKKIRFRLRLTLMKGGVNKRADATACFYINTYIWLEMYITA